MNIDDALRSTVETVNELWTDPVDTAERLARLQDRIAAQPGSVEAAGHLRWLLDRVAFLLGAPVESIDPEARLVECGMDSLLALRFHADLRERFGLDGGPALLWKHPTLKSLSAYLATVLPAGASGEVPKIPADNVSGRGAGGTSAE
ncbi:acyl carrier protein [Streptomyces sp. NBC_00536]|uniref:acyl carrier protein n=1 Tax=Streptomyces sp. NBC_00536 TaxID=2975769 RepID=UPI002E80386C|nr:acyl carrier protein [Streptomyces sp. NBC_00536]WUC76982.1 acyl carrier protein [Streptomyces sp. NBC_00536]